MPTIIHTTEQIIAKLRKAEILFAEGKQIDEVAKILEVNKLTENFQQNKNGDKFRFFKAHFFNFTCSFYFSEFFLD